MAAFQWEDTLVFVIFILASISVGVYYGCTGGKQNTMMEFLVGNKKMQMAPTMISLLVSYSSSVLVIGGTAEVFSHGTFATIWEILARCIGILMAERIMTPWLYQMNLVSANEFFERRYRSKSVRLVGCFLNVSLSLVYMGLTLYASSVALEAASGFSSLWSMPVMAAVCVLYTAMGGIKAVIWTDFLQFLILLAGMLAVMVKAILSTEHIDAYAVAYNASRIKWLNFDPNPHTRQTVWGFIFGYSWMWFFMYGCSQPSVQRISAVKNIKQARLIVLLNIPFTILLFASAFITGLFVFVYYSIQRCDPLQSGMVHSPNQILVTFVEDVFQKYRGFIGLFIATIYSAGYSSVSSCLSAATANTWEDVLKFRLHVSEITAVYINKFLVVLFGVLATGVALIVYYSGGPVIQIAGSMMSALAAPLGTMFLIGGMRFLQPHVEAIGACCGGVAGLAINVWISVGRAFIKGTPPLPPVETSGCAPPFNETMPHTVTREIMPPIGIEYVYRISYLLTAPIGIITTVVVTLVVSRIAMCFYSPDMTSLPDHLFLTGRGKSTYDADISVTNGLRCDDLKSDTKSNVTKF